MASDTALSLMKIPLLLATALLLAGCNESELSSDATTADEPRPQSLPNSYTYEKHGPRTVILLSTSAEGTAYT